MFDDLYLNPVNGENERRGTILQVRIYKCTKLQHTTHELSARINVWASKLAGVLCNYARETGCTAS